MPRGPAPADGARIALVLDADGLTKLARRDRRVREMVLQVVVEGGGALVVPPTAVIQALAEGPWAKAIDEILDGAIQPDIDRERIRLAAQLLVSTATHDIPDALVATEALLRRPSIVITSDPRDIRALLDVEERGGRVEIWEV